MKATSDAVFGQLAHDVLGCMAEGCQLIGRDFTYLYVNRTVAAQGRSSPAALVGQTMIEAYPGIENTPMFAVLREAMVQRVPQTLDNEFTFPDGQKAWFELRFQPVEQGVLIFSFEITERKRAEEALRRSHRALRALSESNQTLVRAVDEQQFMRDVCRIAVERGGYRMAWIGGRIESNTDRLLPLASAGTQGAHATVVALPFFVSGQVAGALNIYSDDVDAFDQDETALLAELALDLGYGVQTLREREAGKRDAARVVHLSAVLKGIRGINLLIIRERDPRTLMRAACDFLVETNGFDACCIATCVDEQLVRIADAGTPGHVHELHQMLASCSMPGGVLRIADELETSNGEGLRRVAVRMASGGVAYGLILVALPRGVSVDDDEMALLHEVAEDIAFALRSIEDQAERQRAETALRASNESSTRLNHRLQGLTKVVQDLSWMRDIPTIIAIVRTAARDLTSADGAAFIMREGEQCHFVDEYAMAPLWKGRSFPASECISGWVMEHREAVAIEDVYADERIVAATYRPTFVRSLVMAPIRREKPVGAIGIYWSRVHQATDDDLAILQALADSASIALESVRMVSELQSSEDRYRGLVENLEDVVFSIDAQGNFQYVSPSITKYGYTPSELLGRPFSGFVHEGDHAALAESFGRALAGHVETRMFRARDKHGKEHFVRTASRAIVHGGKPIGINGVLMDITELKQTEEQLRDAQRMEAVGQLAGGVAHDFNNLLSVILSYAGFVSEAVANDKQVLADVEEITKASTRAAALTRQLLAFSRRQVLEPQVLDLNRVTGDLENMLRRLIGEDINLEKRLARDLGRVKADPGQLEQVIMNLVVNARDAMPLGGKITIETANATLDENYAAQHPGSSAGAFVMLAITDSGTGMDEATKQRLFEPFFTTKELGKGTGLGLSTVHGIVKQSGGDISVYSELGIGTTFKVYLPRVLEPAVDSTRPRQSLGPPVGTETILLVEDDAAVRSLAARALRGGGYNVIDAGNGAEALQLAAAHSGPLDLLVTDVIMPGMSGKQLAERLLQQRPGLRVLYMSGYTDNALEHHGVLAPGTMFIGKPFTGHDLARKVRNVIDAQPESQSVRFT